MALFLHVPLPLPERVFFALNDVPDLRHASTVSLLHGPGPLVTRDMRRETGAVIATPTISGN